MAVAVGLYDHACIGRVLSRIYILGGKMHEFGKRTKRLSVRRLSCSRLYHVPTDQLNAIVPTDQLNAITPTHFTLKTWRRPKGHSVLYRFLQLLPFQQGVLHKENGSKQFLMHVSTLFIADCWFQGS